MTLIFWRCTKCDNLLVRPEWKDRPDRCYNCRSGESPLGNERLYAKVERSDLVEGLSK